MVAFGSLRCIGLEKQIQWGLFITRGNGHRGTRRRSRRTWRSRIRTIFGRRCWRTSTCLGRHRTRKKLGYRQSRRRRRRRGRWTGETGWAFSCCAVPRVAARPHPSRPRLPRGQVQRASCSGRLLLHCGDSGCSHCVRGCLAVSVATVGPGWCAVPELGSAACPEERVERQ